MCCSKIHLPLWIHILLAMWAVVFSVLEFLVFLFYFGNVFLAVTALSSLVPAALCFQLYSMEKAGNVESSLNKNALGCLFYFGLLGCIFAIAGAITYFTLGIAWQIPVFEMHRTLILCGLEACLGARWYYELAHISRGYAHVTRGGRRTKEITI
ncbi:hypothetical protein TCAL_09937 [Tigriopus californicus]|uniref:Uncharacterized protein n=1 Tax=Tigriopus californicus TaxID=6832 RepID=A0A553PSV3_TIGCA|nr:uncharacterized protein LOC131892310 [Tigriopus californicus]TRY80745.1 hypothetical protein TCAL_09937 [Tigriopus californicus]